MEAVLETEPTEAVELPQSVTPLNSEETGLAIAAQSVSQAMQALQATPQAESLRRAHQNHTVMLRSILERAGIEVPEGASVYRERNADGSPGDVAWKVTSGGSD